MKMLELPHRLADYLCPVNGLCDIYEWKTGERIPEELVFYARTGFILISQKRLNPPKMIFMSTISIGKKLFEFWGNMMKYRLIASEGKSFKHTLSNIKALIDNNIPVILFGLDMYHLPYQKKFYHHLHIPGHVILMAGYDDKVAYVHDNSKLGVKVLPYEDLQLAWQNGYMGICKKNAYFGLDFVNMKRDSKEILHTAYLNAANSFLNPKTGFSGIRGMDKLIKELPQWKDSYDTKMLKSIYTHFVMYTGSVLPGLPAKLDKSSLEIDNPHQGLRDRLALSLNRYRKQFGNESWIAAERQFERSGEIIEVISDGFVEDILNNSFDGTDKYVSLFSELKQSEEKAYQSLLG